MQANKWDDQFRDHAWAEMRKLLDEEMPERALPWWRRIGNLWLVLLLLMALPVLGGTWWLVQQDRDTEDLDSLPVPIREVGTPEQAVAEPTLPSTKGTVRNAAGRSSANQPPGAEVAAVSGDTEPSSRTPVKSASASASVVIGAPTDRESSDSSVLGAKQIPEVEEVATDVDRISAVSLLSTLPVATLPIQSAIQTNYEYPNPVKPRFQTGITVAARAAEFPGLSLGVIGRNTFGHSRFGWETGLRLGLQVRNTGLFNSAEQATFQVDDQDPGQIANPNEAVFQISGPVYYLSGEAPVHLNMRVGPSWKLFTGLRAEYVFRARNPGGSPIPANLANESGQFLDFARNEANAGAGTFSRRPFGLYSRLGAEWQLSPQFSLTTAFEVGLLDLQPALAGFQGRIAGELQMRWYFTHPTR